MNSKSYDYNVFVNCPFDDTYEPLFQAMIFAIHNSGYKARCALEISDSARNRLEKIMKLIQQCKYGVHDISRTELDPKHQLPRFNMALELGIFLGCKRYGKKMNKAKSCIVFDKDQYRYQKFVSDIAGQDIEAHENKPAVLIRKLRKWLRTATNDINIPGGDYIYDNFNKFSNDLPDICKIMKIGIHELTYADYVDFIVKWLTNYEGLMKNLAKPITKSDNSQSR